MTYQHLSEEQLFEGFNLPPVLIHPLEKIAALHSTDKNDHGYIPYYAIHMPEKIHSMLEIGCFMGSSLAMWREHYGNDCDIHTMDLFLDIDHLSYNDAIARGFEAHKGDQGDVNFLKKITHEFDVIIDDGSHNSHHQQITFKQMFIHNLKPGGLYVVEDLHCCKDEFYWSNKVKGFGDTMLFAMKDYLENNRLKNSYFTQSNYLKSQIESVRLYNDKIVFIRKKI